MTIHRTCSCLCAVTALVAIAPRASFAQDTTRARGDTGTSTLPPITITATPVRRAEPDNAIRIDSLTLRLTPAATPYALLRQSAGLEVHQQGQGPGFASDASLRGFSSDHATDIALWVDGVPINEPVNGHAEGYNDWSVLFPQAVQDIDVIHGPTSALFGNFALAGVVNVRTLERMKGTSVSVTGGSYGETDISALTGFDQGANGGVVGARVQREDGFRPNSRSDITQGHLRLVHDLEPGWTIDGGAELYGANWNSPGFLSEDEFAAHDYGVVSNTTDGGYKRRAQERVSVRGIVGSALWRSTLYSTQSRWQLFLTIPPAGGKFEGSGSQTEEEDSRAGVGATSALTWGMAHGSLTLGGDMRWDRSHYENYFTTSRSRDSAAALIRAMQISGAPFVQGQIDATDRLQFNLGARYDVLGTRSTDPGDATISATHAVLSPKLGSLFRLTSSVGLYGNVSRGFRSSDGVIEDPTLTPITEWAYEGGVKFDRPGVTATAALFRADVSNEQTFNPVTLESSNGGASRRQGLELGWTLPALHRLFVFAGDWTFNDARYTSLTAVPEDGGTPVTLNGARIFNTSKYVGSAALELAPHRAPWRIRVSGNWVGPYSPFDEPGVVLPGYGLGHLTASWSFGAIEAEGGVRNVFNRAFPELVAGDVVSPGEPRTAFLTLRAHM